MNRFDMEDELINLNKISDDIRSVANAMMENEEIDKDNIFIALHGIALLHDARYSIAWDTFLQVFGLEQYAEEECYDD